MERRRFLSAVFGVLVAANAVGDSPGHRIPSHRFAFPSAYEFLDYYRSSYYLKVAVELQALDPVKRAARLRALAGDPSRSSEVFPLCRMLFEPEAAQTFRGPMLGVPVFVSGTDLDWPLEPITLFEDVPILIVRGYSLDGRPELAESYVAYCLGSCRWASRKYATSLQLRQVMERFITRNPMAREHADWLRLQAE